MLQMLILMEVAEKLNEVGFFDKVEEAREDGVEALEALALESEPHVFEVINKVIKKDEEILELGGQEDIDEKNELIEEIVAHQYEFLEVPTPFEKGVTLDEVKARNAK